MHDGAYYLDKLSGHKLFKCYEIAPPGIKRYLNAEIQYMISNLHKTDIGLELGCGYGRVMKEVSPHVSMIVGNDVSRDSLELARRYMGTCGNYVLVQMDASNMGFRSCVFDVVFCIQNGISALGVERRVLLAESIRVTKQGGIILFSSYSPKIWNERLVGLEFNLRLGFWAKSMKKRRATGP